MSDRATTSPPSPLGFAAASDEPGIARGSRASWRLRVEAWFRSPGAVRRVVALPWLLLLIPAAWWSAREYDTARTALVFLLAAAFVIVWIRDAFHRPTMAPAKYDAVVVAIVALLAGLLIVIGGGAWVGTLVFVGARALPLFPGSAGYVVGFRYYLIALGMVGLLATIVLSVSGAPWFKLVSVVVVGVGVVGLVSELATKNRALMASREQVSQLAAEAERLSIARDLHDALGHSLTVLAVKTDLARRTLDTDAERARSEMNAVAEIAQSTLAEVRAIVTGYRRPHLAVELAAARATLATVGDVRIETEDVCLQADVDEALAWAVREGVTNVLRHSNARRCTVRFAASVDAAIVEVVNDGAQPSDHAGHGLVGLHERIRAVNGTLECWSTSEDGEFGIRVTVPLGKSRT